MKLSLGLMFVGSVLHLAHFQSMEMWCRNTVQSPLLMRILCFWRREILAPSCFVSITNMSHRPDRYNIAVGASGIFINNEWL